MPLPRAVARFNKRYTNRFLEPIVSHSSGFAVVHHIGRSSGRPFATPVNVFADRASEDPAVTIVALTYGPGADWVRNVQSGPARVDFGDGNHRSVESMRVVGRDRVWASLPRLVRAVLRTLGVRDFAVLTCRTIVSCASPSGG